MVITAKSVKSGVENCHILVSFQMKMFFKCVTDVLLFISMRCPFCSQIFTSPIVLSMIHIYIYMHRKSDDLKAVFQVVAVRTFSTVISGGCCQG